MYELLDAIEAVVMSTDPAKREALAQTLNAYREDFRRSFFGDRGTGTRAAAPFVDDDRWGDFSDCGRCLT
jgi:hypothetical protein